MFVFVVNFSLIYSHFVSLPYMLILYNYNHRMAFIYVRQLDSDSQQHLLYTLPGPAFETSFVEDEGGTWKYSSSEA